MILYRIAKTIRNLRQQKGMTQEALASKIGVSKAFISKIENHNTTPSIGSLSRIAHALGVTISTLFDEERKENQNIAIVRKRERKKIVGPGSDIGFSYESLAFKKKNKIMEPFLIKYPSNTHTKRLFDHEGEEFVFVLKGKIKLIYGDNQYILNEGDTAYFNSAIPHRGESVGKGEGIGLCILVSPR
jgi:transcriptional regulator with XRE-family HTH domain